MSNLKNTVIRPTRANVLVMGCVACLLGGALNGFAAQQKVSIAYSGIGSVFAGLWVAKDIRAFEKYGLESDLVYIASGPVTVAALIAGQVDMAIAASNTVIAAIDKGAPLVAVGTTTSKPPFVVWVQPEITRPEQLEGKVLGITRFGSATHFLTELALEKLGLKDKVKLQQYTSSPATDAAFRARMIAGRVTTQRPSPQARALVHLADLEIPFSLNFLAVARGYLQKAPKNVDAMLRAYIEGVAIVKTRKERTVQILEKYARQRSTGTEEIEQMYDAAVKYLEGNPRIDPIVVRQVLASMGGSNTHIDKFYDNTILDQISKDGFIERLYSGKAH